MIDPDERCHVLGEALGQPLREFAACPIFARARRWPKFPRQRTSIRLIDSQPRKARCGRLCARVVDADVSMKGRAGHIHMQRSKCRADIADRHPVTTRALVRKGLRQPTIRTPTTSFFYYNNKNNNNNNNRGGDMQLEPMNREFSYSGLRLADPDNRLTPEQVRDFYSSSYPEITTASIEGPEVADGVLKFKFTRVLGTKG